MSDKTIGGSATSVPITNASRSMPLPMGNRFSVALHSPASRFLTGAALLQLEVVLPAAAS